MSAWTPTTAVEHNIERVARALMVAERRGTEPDHTRVFFYAFRWDGELGSHALEHRPAWTAPRIIRMARAAMEAILP